MWLTHSNRIKIYVRKLCHWEIADTDSDMDIIMHADSPQSRQNLFAKVALFRNCWHGLRHGHNHACWLTVIAPKFGRESRPRISEYPKWAGSIPVRIWCMYACMYACVYVCMCLRVCMHVFPHMHIYKKPHIHTQTHTNMCFSRILNAYSKTGTSTRTHIHARIHTHTHTQIEGLL